MMNQQITASQQIQQLTQQLTQKLIEKEDAQLKLAEADKAILAIRNVLAGIGLGQQLAAETAVPAQAGGAE